MTVPVQPIAVYFAFVSLLSVILTVADKRRAVRGAWRVPENTLILFALLGGAAVMYLTMKMIRHKTRRPKFTVGLPFMIILQIALAGCAVYFF